MSDVDQMHAFTDEAYAGVTDPRRLAYRAVWHQLWDGSAKPSVWRTVHAVLDAYEAALANLHQPSAPVTGAPTGLLRGRLVAEFATLGVTSSRALADEAARVFAEWLRTQAEADWRREADGQPATVDEWAPRMAEAIAEGRL